VPRLNGDLQEAEGQYLYAIGLSRPEQRHNVRAAAALDESRRHDVRRNHPRMRARSVALSGRLVRPDRARSCTAIWWVRPRLCGKRLASEARPRECSRLESWVTAATEMLGQSAAARALHPGHLGRRLISLARTMTTAALASGRIQSPQPANWRQQHPTQADQGQQAAEEQGRAKTEAVAKQTAGNGAGGKRSHGSHTRDSSHAAQKVVRSDGLANGANVCSGDGIDCANRSEKHRDQPPARAVTR